MLVIALQDVQPVTDRQLRHYNICADIDTNIKYYRQAERLHRLGTL